MWSILLVPDHGHVQWASGIVQIQVTSHTKGPEFGLSTTKQKQANKQREPIYWVAFMWQAFVVVVAVDYKKITDKESKVPCLATDSFTNLKFQEFVNF